MADGKAQSGPQDEISERIQKALHELDYGLQPMVDILLEEFPELRGEVRTLVRREVATALKRVSLTLAERSSSGVGRH